MNMMIGSEISTVDSNHHRPLWSVMIPTYNCDKYLVETLQSVLIQAPNESIMQIEVIDDCSTDNVEEIARLVGRGRVSFYRNEVNQGATRNFNVCLNRSKGHLVHILHGDDTVIDGFYKEIESLVQRYPTLGLYCTRSNIVDERGGLENLNGRVQWMEEPTSQTHWIDYNCPFNTPAMVVKRMFYERHGGFLPHLVHSADWEMWHRAIMYGGAIMSNKALTNYRYFASNDTSRLMKTGENLMDFIRFGQTIRNRVTNFNPELFMNRIKDLAYQQANRFTNLNDHISASNNIMLANKIEAREIGL